MPAKVAAIEYDPNRTAPHRAPALRGRREALHPRADRPRGGRHAPLRRRRSTSGPATRCRSASIPLGTVIHNVELAAGLAARQIDPLRRLLRPAHGEGGRLRPDPHAVRRGPQGPPSTAGRPSASSATSSTTRSASARPARAAGSGIRPTVRGLAMNPVDHPHGGGEGKSGQGNPHPVSPWGQQTKGLKTRNNQPHRQVHRHAAPARRAQHAALAGENRHGAFHQEGPVRRQAPHQEGRGREQGQQEVGHQDLVAALHHHPGLRRATPSPCTTAASSSRCS